MRISGFTLKIVTGLLVFCLQANAQISTREEPASFRKNVSDLRTSEKTQIILPSLDIEKIQQEDKEDEENGIPPRFGYIHDVSLNLDNSGEWTVLSDGSRIWRLALHCPDALSINLLYDKFWVPDDAKFFVYSNDRRHSIGAFTSLNNKGSRNDTQGFATGLVYSDQVTLEYYLPNNVKDVGIISISGIVHGYRYIMPEYWYGNVPGNNLSGNCQVNINCPEGNNWQNEKRAVALIIVNGTRMCTGSLVNNTNNDNSPYFLTADHCLVNEYGSKIYDAINNPNLNNWTFYWNYELPPNPNDCNYNTSTPSTPLVFSTSGAIVKANNPTSDFALIELSESPIYFVNHTPSYIPYFLGWDRTGNSGTGGVGIHHPCGDVKKIATHNITPPTNSNCMDFNYNGGYLANSNFWRINWMATPNGHSVTEGGSSGSPLLNNSGRVIGQLFGAGYCSNPNCSNPPADIGNYGKFSVSWTGNGATDNQRRLSSWLDPNNTNATTLNGISCPTVVNLIGTVSNPIVVTANRTVTSCGNINVQYVKVQKYAKLILDAAGEVNIISDFEVEPNAEFEIIK